MYLIGNVSEHDYQTRKIRVACREIEFTITFLDASYDLVPVPVGWIIVVVRQYGVVYVVSNVVVE